MNVIRAWQGHTIESRWFNCVKGSFTVKLIEIDNWEKPSKEFKVLRYKLTSEKQEILYSKRLRKRIQSITDRFKTNDHVKLWIQ
jgi:hypothetical protein